MAAGRVRLPVLRTVGTAYGDLVRVVAAMPGLVAIAMAIVIACAVPTAFLPRPTSVIDHVVDFGLDALQDFLLTPFFLAVHRYIILNEITRSYGLDPRDPRFLRFFAWSVAFTAVAAAIVAPQDSTLSRSMVATILLLDIVLFVLLTYMAARLTILFPAIAVDARGAAAANAFADAKGNVFRIFLAVALGYAPFLILSYMVVSPIAEEAPPAAVIVSTALSAPGLPLIIAIASRIFQALADRVVGRTSDSASIS